MALSDKENNIYLCNILKPSFSFLSLDEVSETDRQSHLTCQVYPLINLKEKRALSLSS